MKDLNDKEPPLSRGRIIGEIFAGGVAGYVVGIAGLFIGAVLGGYGPGELGQVLVMAGFCFCNITHANLLTASATSLPIGRRCGQRASAGL